MLSNRILPLFLLIFVANSAFAQSFDKQWKTIDSLEKKGLPQSAMEKVENLRMKAKQEENWPQWLKGGIFWLKYSERVFDDSLVTQINKLREIAPNLPEPGRQVLYSYLGEFFQQYYSANQWQFRERTNVSTEGNPDFSTWDLRSILEVMDHYYRLSHQNEALLKTTPSDQYKLLFTESRNTDGLLPTLFDLLVYRNLQFLAFQKSNSPEVVGKFNLPTEQNWFVSGEEFLKINITSPDSSDAVFQSLILFRKVLAFHQNDKNPTAFADADLRRITFLKEVKSNSTQDDLAYLGYLENFIARYTTNPISAEARYVLASFLVNKNNQHLYNYSEKPRSPRASGDGIAKDLATARRLCNEAIQTFPDSYGGKNCRNLLATILKSSLRFQVEQDNVPNKPFRLALEYKNQDLDGKAVPMHFRIFKLGDDQAQEWFNSGGGWNQIEKLLKTAPVKTFAIILPGETDLLPHSTEIAVPALPPGQYVVAACKAENFVAEQNEIAYDAIRVTDIVISNSTMPGEKISLGVMSRETGEPIAEAKIELYNQDYDYKSGKNRNKLVDTFTSDSKGLVILKGNKNQYNNTLHITVGNDSYWSGRGIYFNGNEPNTNEEVEQISLFTDRSIYRPGQTVHFKGIYTSHNRERAKLVLGRNVTVLLKDANYQDVTSISLGTNDFGSFHGSFVLPTGRLNGNFTIATAYGSVSFSVEEYKRPKYEVKILPIEGSFKLGDDVVAVLEAKTYTGLPVSNAKVNYRVTRSQLYTWYYSKYSGGGKEDNIAVGVIETDANGKAEIRFKAVPEADAEKNQQFRFALSADVSDANGESHSAETSILIGAKAFGLGITLPNQFDVDTLKTLKVTATNSGGQRMKEVSGFVSIYKLSPPNHFFRNRLWPKPDRFLLNEGEYRTQFPYDVYNNEKEQENFPKTLVTKLPFNTSKDSIVSLKDVFKSGYYYVKVEGVAKGDTVMLEAYLDAVSGSKPEVNKSELFAARLLTDKVNIGGTVAFELASSMAGTKVLMEVYTENRELNTQTITLQEWLQLPEGISNKSLKLDESWGQNVQVSFTGQRFNTKISEVLKPEIVQQENKFKFTVETFRNVMEPGKKETWSLKIAGNEGEKLQAEILAGMYDASLDAFRPHSWNFNPFNYYDVNLSGRSSNPLELSNSNIFSKIKYPGIYGYSDKAYPNLNWFGFNVYNQGYRNRGGRGDVMLMSMASSTKTESDAIRSVGKMSKNIESLDANGAEPVIQSFSMPGGFDKYLKLQKKEEPTPTTKPEPSPRKNLQETAFFFPQLKTDESGAAIVEFTVPEALTSWNFKALAHTKDLRFAQLMKEAVTKKTLMVTPNWPRFLREGDTITMSAKVNSMYPNPMDKEKDAVGTLKIVNPITGLDISKDLLISQSNPTIAFGKGGEGLATWMLKIPQGIVATEISISATMGSFTDGEVMTIPVVPNRMQVTETLPISVKAGQSKSVTFGKLLNNASTTLSHEKVTVEWSTNPAWYAIQALPYLLEGEMECSEQVFNRFYANTIGSAIANSNPKIRTVFEVWKRDADALKSNLEKNQDLKTANLEETPWVREAQSEAEQKRRVAQLFDMVKLESEMDNALKKLAELQSPNGGFVWFPKMPEDRYITQHIVEGLGHLQQLGFLTIKEKPEVQLMLDKALLYLNGKLKEDYNWLTREKMNMDEVRVTDLQLHYLYALSYFPDQSLIDIKADKVYAFYRKQMAKYWVEEEPYGKGMIALIASRQDNKQLSDDVLKSLKETAINNPELGMYWKAANEGYWHQAPVETNSLMVEVFAEAAKDQASVDNLKTWLLKNKQTNNWKSSKATAEACYALLLGGMDWLGTETKVELKLGNITITPAKDPDLKTEAGTGYFKKTYSAGEVNKEMGRISVSESGSASASWGAVYWQYYENLDKITPSATPLNVNKMLYLLKNTAKGEVLLPLDEKTKLKKGDKLKVRIEIRTDRAMEYVHLRDMRASGFEPVEALSGYCWQDGLGYYQSPKDLSTDFFIHYLQKGTYVFEYPLWVQHSGKFSNGITTIECMYAPEFTSHSEGVRVEVE